MDILDPWDRQAAGGIAGITAASPPEVPHQAAAQITALEAENAMLRGMLRAAQAEAEQYQRLYEAEVARRHQPPPTPRGSAAWEPLKARIMDLIRLCHPDRHGGSATSTEVTRILLEIREKQ